jgi:hypothetical protein
MRLRPSPLVEASASFAVSFLLVIGIYWAIYRDLNSAFSLATVAALFFMFPIFSAWAFVGYLVRDRTIMQRFAINVGLTVLVTGGLSLFLITMASEPQSSNSAATLVETALVVAISNVVSAAIAYRFLVDDNKTKLAKTAYTTVNTASGSKTSSSKNSKRKKK